MVAAKPGFSSSCASEGLVEAAASRKRVPPWREMASAAEVQQLHLEQDIWQYPEGVISASDSNMKSAKPTGERKDQSHEYDKERWTQSRSDGLAWLGFRFLASLRPGGAFGQDDRRCIFKSNTSIY
jgi:hypothetical protein